MIILHGEQNDAVCSRFPNFAFSCHSDVIAGDNQSLDGSRSLIERRPLRTLSYLPHQTVLESKRPFVVEALTDPYPKATNNNRWVLWALSSLNVVVFVAIIIIVSKLP